MVQGAKSINLPIVRVYPTSSSPKLMHICFPHKYRTTQPQALHTACIIFTRSYFVHPLCTSYDNHSFSMYIGLTYFFSLTTIIQKRILLNGIRIRRQNLQLDMADNLFHLLQLQEHHPVLITALLETYIKVTEVITSIINLPTLMN